VPEIEAAKNRPNRLVHETSPYLLQHAYNPVDWHPWCQEALDKARSQDRLILLSIGYSACHWCHVMERESFENEETAAVMNEHFINIKVDREERPDLDDIYMAATLALNHGQGGWPMTVFITPQLEPVFAGTYFPLEGGPGRPSFRTVLTAVAKAWQEDRSAVIQQAGNITQYLRRQRSESSDPRSVGQSELRLALSQFSDAFDAQYGGFGSAPKFPPSTSLSLLLRLHKRYGEPQALRMVTKTLDAMAAGGMYDHVGGGFARYSTDRFWLVPHFEKMLYDNALLTSVYLEAYQVTKDERYARIAREILDFVLRDMTSAEGGFHSSWDADSEGDEGKYYVWTPDQIAEVLEPRMARCFNAYYDITLEGNWDGKSIPNTPRSLRIVADELKMSADELEATLRVARQAVLTARRNRVPPARDEKIVTAWNALMIAACAAGYAVLQEDSYLSAAATAADFLMLRLVDGTGRLLRAYRSGRAHLPGYLEDYAYLSNALIDLYEAGGDETYLHKAAELAETIVSDFRDADSGAFFSTARQHENLLLRYRGGHDGATPSANAVAAGALGRLSYHFDRSDWRTDAAKAIGAYGNPISRFPRAFARSLAVVDWLFDGPVEIAVVGKKGSSDLSALRRLIGEHYLPSSIVAVADHADSTSDLPLLRGKGLVEGRAAVYICRNFTCRSPITDPSQVREALTAHATAHYGTTETHIW
jgi:uncharacterized protein YyaL (SSP411 family)